MSVIHEISDHPSHWNKVDLGDLAQVISGHGFPKEYQGRTSGELPFLKVGDISREVQNGKKFVSQADNYISRSTADEIGANPIPEGAVVFAKIGEAVKLNRRGVLGQESLVDNNVMALVASEEAISQDYLYYFMQGFDLGRLTRATTVPSIRKSDVLEIKIPLPSLSEQRRIVAKIEELFSNLDAGREDLETAERQVERYRLSVLQAAVEGRLTADWRTTHDPEPADQLLKRIEEERRRGWEEDYKMRRYDIKDKEPPSGWKDRYDPPEKPDEVESGEIPDSWKWVVVDQLSPNIHYGYTESAQDEPVGPKFLRITDIQQDGQVNWEDAPYCEVGEQERKKYLLEPGDILFARTGGTVGKSCLIEDGVPEAVFASYLIRVITVDSIDERYVYLFFQTLDYWRQISEKKTGIGQPNVNATKLSKLKLPLPPLPEQKQIVDEVERLLSVADDASATAEREQTRADRLRQSILKQAFSGELVPHDEDGVPPAVDSTTLETADTASQKDDDSEVEDLLGSTDPDKQIEMDL
ncbi:restriction endonuclease subunit S [Salinibacter altiplanensis]|uniref:restriction endonuclease subunit S n=1 Tax=Salinibacter altiplanensis TaxID=1803181 RepID=UPI000C9ED3BC|nr:restriction endonuclease subunit S [Salinibacter altiplanensis]